MSPLPWLASEPQGVPGNDDIPFGASPDEMRRRRGRMIVSATLQCFGTLCLADATGAASFDHVSTSTTCSSAHREPRSSWLRACSTRPISCAPRIILKVHYGTT